MASERFSMPTHCHGKARVRVLRVFRSSPKHEVREFNVQLRLWSPKSAPSFTAADNSMVVATDTCKNNVYVVAKHFDGRTPEEFAVAVCRHMLKTYSHLVGVDCSVVERRWRRATSDGAPHNHGFEMDAPMEFTASASLDRTGKHPTVVSGVRNYVVLKTTQSAFMKFYQGKYTTLPDAAERCLSTSVTATWQTATGDLPAHPTRTRDTVLKLLKASFFGPPRAGTFSPSVQDALYKMGCAVLTGVPELDEICLDLPNIHFIPFPLDKYGEKFEDDVFVATDEPHGTIRATISRSALETAPLMPPAALRSKL